MWLERKRTGITPIIALQPPFNRNLRLFLKVEAKSPTGSLKHRVAWGLIMGDLVEGLIGPETNLYEASSGNTAIAEAYFARELGLRYTAVVRPGVSEFKIQAIKAYGGSVAVAPEGVSPGAHLKELVAKDRNGFNIDQFADTQDVLANSPPYPGQLANVAAYGNLSCYNLENYSLTGLPGNSSSTSRFARVAKLKQCAENVGGVPTGAPLIATAEEALERASVIIGRVDKVEGETITEATYGTTLSFTRLTVVRIHGRRDVNGRPTSKLYFNTPDNNALRVIDLAKLTFDDGERRSQPFYVDSPRYRRAQDAIPMPPFVDKCKGVCP